MLLNCDRDRATGSGSGSLSMWRAYDWWSKDAAYCVWVRNGSGTYEWACGRAIPICIASVEFWKRRGIEFEAVVCIAVFEDVVYVAVFEAVACIAVFEAVVYIAVFDGVL